MGYRVNNAIIMAAGLSSRFAPISYEKPKALIEVRGEILIERQICQLLGSGIKEIIIIVGYKKEQFYYLQEKYGVTIIENKEYRNRNNNSSIYAVRNYLQNTYICSADNYFMSNPFESEVEDSYYAALFAEGKTDEWCLHVDENDRITSVEIGGYNQWYMMGHAFWNKDFSAKFVRILETVYQEKSTEDKLWEDIYREHISQLPMKIRRYKKNQIYEFDSIDDLRLFDSKYINNSGSSIMQKISRIMDCSESEMVNMRAIKEEQGEVIGVSFSLKDEKYCFYYDSERLSKQEKEKKE